MHYSTQEKLERHNLQTVNTKTFSQSKGGIYALSRVSGQTTERQRKMSKLTNYQTRGRERRRATKSVLVRPPGTHPARLPHQHLPFQLLEELVIVSWPAGKEC